MQMRRVVVTSETWRRGVGAETRKIERPRRAPTTTSAPRSGSTRSRPGGSRRPPIGESRRCWGGRWVHRDRRRASKIRDGIKRSAARKRPTWGTTRRVARRRAAQPRAPRADGVPGGSRPPAPGTTLTGVSPIRRRSGSRTPSRGRRRRGTRPSAAITRRSGTPRMGGPGGRARGGGGGEGGAGAGLARRYWRGPRQSTPERQGAPRGSAPPRRVRERLGRKARWHVRRSHRAIEDSALVRSYKGQRQRKGTKPQQQQQQQQQEEEEEEEEEPAKVESNVVRAPWRAESRSTSRRTLCLCSLGLEEGSEMAARWNSERRLLPSSERILRMTRFLAFRRVFP